MSLTTFSLSRRSILVAFALSCLMAIPGLSLGTRDAAAAGNLVIYSNSLRSLNAASQLTQFGKASCSRESSFSVFRVKLGPKTSECSYSVPVVGRDLQASVTARLLKDTPKKVARRTWMAVNLRQAPDGSKYQLAILPSTRQYSLRKVFPNGKIKYLAFGKKGKVIRGLSEPNRITLRAYNGVGKLPDKTARLLAIVNGTVLATYDDPRGYELKGRDSTISIGSKNYARAAIGSFVNLSVAIPDPF